MVLAVAALITAAAGRPAVAAVIPFHRLLLGPPSLSLLDEQTFYPPSYLSISSNYWDIYHESRGASLHNYDSFDSRIRAVLRRHSRMFGFELTQALLTLEQKNAYTDSDRMNGSRDVIGARALFGFEPHAARLPLRLERLRAAGSAGWGEGFSGDCEVEFEWPWLYTWVRAETFGNKIVVEEAMNGYLFPFHFPFRTDRFSGRAEVRLPRKLRLAVDGGVETSHGEGKEVKGFENRVWNRRLTFGGALDLGLAREHAMHLVPRFEAAQHPPGFRISFLRHVGNGDVGMYFRGTRYLHLQDMNNYDTIFRCDVLVHRAVSVFGGWERLRFKHDGDSFADVWPFTVWDVFLAKRYRLDDLDVRLDTSFLGAGVLAGRGRVELETTGRFEWWRDNGYFDWLERFGTPYLGIFRYQRHTVTTNLRPLYAVQMDVALGFRVTGRSSVRFSGRALVPFGDEPDDGGGSGGGTPPPPGTTEEEEKHKVHGGLLASLEIIRQF